jgi:hypothetical protein
MYPGGWGYDSYFNFSSSAVSCYWRRDHETVRANLSLLRSRLGEQQQPQEDHISFARTPHTNQEPALSCYYFFTHKFTVYRL